MQPACRDPACDVRAGEAGSLVDNGQAAEVALNCASLRDTHSGEAARDIAGLNGCLTVHCERAVAVARAVQRPLHPNMPAQQFLLNVMIW